MRCLPSRDVSANGRLNATAYAILGLLSLRPWTTYELAKQVQRPTRLVLAPSRTQALLAVLPLSGRPFRAENVSWPSGDVVLLCSVEGVY